MTTFSTIDRSLDRYVAEINKYPLLSREDEVALAQCYRRDKNEQSAHRLVVCNLRFVVKTAHEYRGYGLKLLDLIQEGNIGLMIAVKKFDPDKGYRLVSYAVWWIRAYIQSFIMRAWSLVKVGTTQAQRKLFFKLRSERERADRLAGPGAKATTRDLALQLAVGESDVQDMEMRLAERDFSLDAKVAEDSRLCHLDLLAADLPDQEEQYSNKEMRRLLRGKVHEAMDQLNQKERYVIENRIMSDEPPTLQEIGQKLSISRERVRQIEGNIIRKIRAALVESGIEPLAA